MVGKALRRRLRARLSPRLRRRHLLRLHLGWRRETDLPEPLEAAGVTAFSDAVWVVGGTRPALVVRLSTRCGSTRRAGSRAQSCPCGSTACRSPVTGSDCSSSADGRPTQRVGTRRSAGTCGSLTVPTMSWEVLNRIPEERAGGAVAWDGKRLVFAGGVDRQDLDGDGKAESINHADVWVWEGEREWREIGQLQRQRKTWWLPATGTAGMVSRRCRCSRRGSPGAVGRRGPREKDRITPLSISIQYEAVLLFG